jgi:predicted PurR-regulated permease PerM
MQQEILKNIYFWLVPTFIILLWYLRDIFFILFFSFVLGIAIQEWSIAIKRYLKIPFFINIILIYLIFVFILIFSIYVLLPIIIKEIKSVYPQIQDILESYGIKNLSVYFSGFLKNTPETLFNFSSYFFNLLGGIFNFILIIILSFYVATQPNFITDIFKFFLSENQKPYLNLYIRIKRKFAFWLSAQIFLMIIIAVLVYILMFVLKIPYAGLIAFIAGLTEIIPILGPIISASFAIFITLANDPDKIFWVIGGFILIQQIENNLIIPLIARKVFEIRPIITLSAILIGAKLGGILGILTVLPFSVILVEIYYEFFKIDKLKT